MSLCRGHSHFPRPLFRILFATIQPTSLPPRRCAVTYMFQPENASCHSCTFLISRRIEARVPSNGLGTVQEYQKISLIIPLEWGILEERRKVSANSQRFPLALALAFSCSLLPYSVRDQWWLESLSFEDQGLVWGTEIFNHFSKALSHALKRPGFGKPKNYNSMSLVSTENVFEQNRKGIYFPQIHKHNKCQYERLMGKAWTLRVV